MKRMVMLALVLIAGCEDERECDPRTAEGGSYCDGNALYSCEHYGDDAIIPYSWERTSCLAEGKVCVAVDDHAFCALPSETCPEEMESRRSFCRENSVAECRDGYVTSMDRCEGDSECIDSFFVSDNTEPYLAAVCSMGEESCPENTTSYCSDGAVIECLYGYPHEVEEQCEGDGVECREMVVHGLWFDSEVQARCVSTDQPCPANSLGYCIDEGEYQQCWAGFQFSGPQSCGASLCVEDTDEIGNTYPRCLLE